MVKGKRTEHGAERGLWDGEAHRHYRENFLGQWQPLLTCCRCPGMLSKHRMLQSKGGTQASKNVSSSSLGKPGHVDAVGGAGHSWWWMNVWPWARRQGRGVTCNDKTGKSERLEDRKVTYPGVDVAGRFNSHRRAAQRLTLHCGTGVLGYHPEASSAGALRSDPSGPRPVRQKSLEGKSHTSRLQTMVGYVATARNTVPASILPPLPRKGGLRFARSLPPTRRPLFGLWPV